MKSLHWILAVSLLMVSFSVAFAQDEIIVLGDDAFGQMERIPVSFPHERHTNAIEDCARCHHDYDAYGVNTGGEGQKCSECHVAEPNSQDNPVPLMRAYHQECKSCHGKLRREQSKLLPIMCGQCHVR